MDEWISAFDVGEVIAAAEVTTKLLIDLATLCREQLDFDACAYLQWLTGIDRPWEFSDAQVPGRILVNKRQWEAPSPANGRTRADQACNEFLVFAGRRPEPMDFFFGGLIVMWAGQAELPFEDVMAVFQRYIPSLR